MGRNIDYIIWLGVRFNGKPFTGFVDLPKEIEEAIKLADEKDYKDHILVEGLKFQQIPWYATDPNYKEGFGVVVYWYDAGDPEESLDLKAISDRVKKVMPKIKKAFLVWGINEEPRMFQCITSCDWSQG